MSTIGNNPIIEIEEFVNRYYNFLRYIKSGLLQNIINSENECNLYIEKSSKLYLLYSTEKANEIENSINILKGIYINGDDRQLEAFKKIISSNINLLRKELSEIKKEIEKKEYGNCFELLKQDLSDWFLFEHKYIDYFEKPKQSIDFKKYGTKLRFIKTIEETKKTLNILYEKFSSENNIIEFLDYLEYEYIPQRKAKINADHKLLNSYNFNPVINNIFGNPESRLLFIEKSVAEQRQINRTKTINDKKSISKDTSISSEDVSEHIYPKTQTNIPFEAKLFKDEYSTKLFCYLIDHYHSGKDKELSNIYQWMENKNFIQESKRKEFKELVKEHEITKQKYNRVHASTEYDSANLDPTFNELKKRFDHEIKK